MFSPARHRLAANPSGIDVRFSGAPAAGASSTTAASTSPPSTVAPGGTTIPTPPLAAGGAAGMNWFWPALIVGVGVLAAYDYSKGQTSTSRA